VLVKYKADIVLVKYKADIVLVKYKADIVLVKYKADIVLVKYEADIIIIISSKCHFFSSLSRFQYLYEYFTIYRWYFLLKFEQFSWISYATLFKIRRYQRPF
jgi:hypothetical protein